MQVPAAIPVTVVPEIVQIEEVVEVSVTARPEVTVAVALPYILCPGGASKQGGGKYSRGDWRP